MVWYNRATSGSLSKLKAKKVTPQIINRTICHKSKLPPKNVKHWPYEKYSWGFHNWFLDPFTRKKFDENSKIIQVEGNVAAGKQEFARKLADQLGMVYFPPVDIEDLLINKHGFDYRAINPLLPERLRHCDMPMFHENPARHSVIHLQYHLFRMRVLQYLKACRHIFNTGQGVVLTRSCFTEAVFVEAMHNIGWLPTGYLRGDGVRFYDWKLRHNHLRNYVLFDIPKAHLTIYLDTPVDICLERIRNDPDPAVANSNALTREFLEAIETAYLDVTLPKQEANMNVLRYEHLEDRSDDEILDVIDDIEELDFEYDVHDTRFSNWEPKYLHWYFINRRRFTSRRFAKYLRPFDQHYFDIAGMGDSITDADLELRKGLMEGHVGPFGYNQSYGTDLRVQNVVKAFFDIPSFGETCDRELRADYL